MSGDIQQHISSSPSRHGNVQPRVSAAQSRSVATQFSQEAERTRQSGVFYRLLIAIEVLFIALIWVSLFFNAPLEQLADPMHTPNPAKAPWYFLGLQELLHYFPPVIAGVLIPGFTIMGLLAIPYLNVNIGHGGLFLSNRARRVQVFASAVVALCAFLATFKAWVALLPTLVVAALVAITGWKAAQGKTRGLVARPLSFWIVTWFLAELIVLTAVGTFFRGPGWSWVLPWRGR